jgi:putative tricarboxylic transport membrane protein
MFIFFGAAALYIAQQDYPMGSAGRMGPGYFPSVLAGLLTLVGIIAVIRSLIRPGEAVGHFAFKQTFLVLGGVLLFAALVRTAGLVVAILVLALVSLYASSQFRWKSAVIFAIAAVIFCVLVFVKGLGVPMPILGSWFGN